MEITNLKTDHEWQHIPCQKNENCFHCKCKKQFDSIPKNDFIVKDIEGNNITISKITLNYSKKDEVIGWFF
jgi:hypothetical protein